MKYSWLNNIQLFQAKHTDKNIFDNSYYLVKHFPLWENRIAYSKYFTLGKVQKADLMCDVIRKVAPFVLSQL